MKTFNSNVEASDYVCHTEHLLYDLEEKLIPFKRYGHFIDKKVGKHQFYSFPPCELADTGFVSVPYVEGKNTYNEKGIPCCRVMPFKIGGQINFASVSNIHAAGFGDRVMIITQEFVEAYRDKMQTKGSESLTDIALRYFTVNHHSMISYQGLDKFIFGKEGVAIAHVSSEGIYITTEFDDSLKIDFERQSRQTIVTLMNKYISGYQGK